MELLALELGSGVLWTLGIVFATSFMRPDLLLEGTLLARSAGGSGALGWLGGALLGLGSLGLVFPDRRKRRGGGAPTKHRWPLDDARSWHSVLLFRAR